MCGISGIYNCLNKPINSRKIVEKIVKLQHSRGPDNQGIWQSSCGRLFFDHNRLSIKKEFANPIRDWSIYIYKKYLNQ